MFDKDEIGCLGVIGLVLLVIILIIIDPLLSFIFGWLIGWCAKLVIGAKIVSGFAIFGITITEGMIPFLFGFLNVVGSFFRSKNYTKYVKKGWDD